jgi:hypothetical protein
MEQLNVLIFIYAYQDYTVTSITASKQHTP